MWKLQNDNVFRSNGDDNQLKLTIEGVRRAFASFLTNFSNVNVIISGEDTCSMLFVSPIIFEFISATLKCYFNYEFQNFDRYVPDSTNHINIPLKMFFL